MPELLKNRYNYQAIQDLAWRINAVYPLFMVNNFINDIMDTTWDKLELKARMRKITINLGKYLPTDYEQALAIIDKVIDHYPAGFNDFTLMYFPDFVEIYGQNEDYWLLSIAALERYTKCSSSEFAVRPFIINDEQRMMQQMLVGTKNKNEHVRRLASEGCRPQLPGAQALVSFKKNPDPIIDILEQLKDDSSLYVRKSVANNLNDISKTHPQLVIKIVREGHGKSKRTDGILKHGCRTLLKKGNQDILAIFGFKKIDCVNINDFALHCETIVIGEVMSFSFLIEAKTAVKLRLEYGIDFVKANGNRSRKIFQISETALIANTIKAYTKKHSFVDLSTRKHYSGIHSLTLIINGIAGKTLDFVILVPKPDLSKLKLII